MLIGVAAHAIGIGHALRVENVADFVGLVTVDAGGENIGLLLPEFATNRFAVNLLDLRMALRAGGGNVTAIDGRVRIGVRQNAVRRMAGHARRGHDQALLHHGLAVDALGIILEDVVLINLAVHLDGRTFTMASTTDEWNIERSDGGTVVLYREDVVIAVAVNAVRGESVAASNGFAVKRRSMKLLFVAVAGTAHDRRHARIMRQILAVERGVAVGAGQRAMHRGGKFLDVNKKRDRAIAALDGHGLVTVASEAVVVSGTRRGGGSPGQQQHERRSQKRHGGGPAA